MKPFVVAVVLAWVTPAAAQMSYGGVRYFERIDRDDALRRLERTEHDRALREDREARVANRDRRDAYRRGER